MNRQQAHRLFQFSILIKGAHAFLECIGGIAIALIDTTTVVNFVNRATQDELLGDPNDFIARHLQIFAQQYSVQTKHFYAFYLLSHGIVKLLLVVGLLRGKLWSYPVSLLVLALFIVYQVYRYSFTHSVGLVLLTVFDLLVMALIWNEYRMVHRKLRSHEH